MAKSKKRTREVVEEEAQRLAQARERIKARIAELETAIATGVVEEQESRQESLRKGYPAKASARLRDMKTEQDDLRAQLEDVARMEVRVDLERLHFDIEDVREQRQRYVDEVARIEPRFKEIEEELERARTKAQNTRAHEANLNEAISRTQNRLLQIDAEYRVAMEQERERRTQELESAMVKQREEQIREFNESGDASFHDQGYGVPTALAPADGE